MEFFNIEINEELSAWYQKCTFIRTFKNGHLIKHAADESCQPKSLAEIAKEMSL